MNYLGPSYKPTSWFGRLTSLLQQNWLMVGARNQFQTVVTFDFV